MWEDMGVFPVGRLDRHVGKKVGAWGFVRIVSIGRVKNIPCGKMMGNTMPGAKVGRVHELLVLGMAFVIGLYMAVILMMRT